MTRRRWAGAWVLLLATVLLNSRTPGPPLDTAVRTVAAAQAAPTVAAEPAEPVAGTAGPAAHGAGDTGDGTRTRPGPCEDGTAAHRAAPRPARTPGAAGAGAPLRQSATDADGTGHRSAVTAVRQAPAAPPPATALLRTYRC